MLLCRPFQDVMVYDAANNITHLQSYGWRQCRLTPGGAKSDDPEENEQIIDAQARMIQVGISFQMSPKIAFLARNVPDASSLSLCYSHRCLVYLQREVNAVSEAERQTNAEDSRKRLDV